VSPPPRDARAAGSPPASASGPTEVGADVLERFTAASVAVRNADLVVAALDAAGAAQVRFNSPRSLRQVVAIHEADFERARKGLADAAPALAAQLGTEPPAPVERALAGVDPSSASSMLLHRPVADPTGNLVLRGELACELQVWRSAGEGVDAAPAGSSTSVRAPRATPWGTWFPPDVFAHGAPSWPLPASEAVDFPIDVVYTWVDDTDPVWAAQRNETMAAAGRLRVHASSAGASRYRNRDELRYSLRSLELFAPFVRHVFIVTADQEPDWLTTDNGRVTVVSHREIFADPDNLPTFNSHAIEAHLHRIEGLSEHYLYLNDDVLFARPVHPRLFFEPNGLHRFFLSRAQIPLGLQQEDDIGVDAAAKNGRRLLEAHLGRRVTQKFKHGPHAQQRSLLLELEQEFPEEIARTAASRFRHPDDVSVPASLVHHYGYLRGAAVPGDLRYDYLHLASLDRAEERFAALLAERDRDALCINDSDVDPVQEARADALVADFLERYLPVPSSFERA
jgi:hypothetical protein